MKTILLILSILLGYQCFSQDGDQKITVDTLHFQNENKTGYVLHTTITHYYNDSSCIWEVSYPEIFGLNDESAEYSINKTFELSVAIGDCAEEDECTYFGAMIYPEYFKYWNRVKVMGIRNNVVSYFYQEGGCTYDEPYCYDNVTFNLYDLNTNSEVDERNIFRSDKKSQEGLHNAIIAKLGFTPQYEQAVDFARQVGFDSEGVIIYYSEFTLGERESYTLRFTLDEIEVFLRPGSRFIQ